jgi:aminopeptidase N
MEEGNTPQRGLTTVKFQKSVPMATYLVAFAVGDFDYTESMTKRGIPVRIYSSAFQVEYTEYASNITANIVDFYEDYFGIPYPLPKLG